MPAIDHQKLDGYLKAGENAQNTSEQGRALEDLICYLFGQVPGIEITQRNTKNTFSTEEIDVALWNDQETKGLNFLPNIILVEVKNWSSRVGGEEVSWFDNKLRSRGLDFGILVCTKGITGDSVKLTAAHHVISNALFEKRKLVVLETTEILKLTNTEELCDLIKVKLCQLAVNGALV